MNLKDTYNLIAKDWVQDHDNDNWWSKGMEDFLALLPTGTSVLDVGCAGGTKSKYISDKGFKVTGVDFSEKMIEIAKERFPEIVFQVCDVYNVSTLEDKFDTIFIQAVLLHIPKKDIVRVLKNIKTLLKPGGFLYVAVKKIKEGVSQEEMKTENNYGYEFERFFSYFSEEEFAGYFKEIGMEVVMQRNTPAGKTAWLELVAR